MQLTIMTVGGA